MMRPVALALLLICAGIMPAAADYGGGVRYWGRGDFTDAARQFLPAAQAGDAESQYMMGRLYSLGDGVPQDFVQAWVWFDRAARHGHILAAQARDILGQQVLTPNQLSQAETMERPVVAPAAPPVVASVVPQAPVAGRSVVLVPRQGVVASISPARPPAGPPTQLATRLATPRNPARLVAPGATVEGKLLAAGDLSQRVREVQRSLIRAGYYDGPVDGALAPPTRQAIRDYQRDIGLPQTGLLSTRMVEQLAATDRALADQQQAAQ